MFFFAASVPYTQGQIEYVTLVDPEQRMSRFSEAPCTTLDPKVKQHSPLDATHISIEYVTTYSMDRRRYARNDQRGAQ